MTTKQIIESLGLTYVRAINTADLNERALRLAVDKIGVEAGLPSISAALPEASGKTIEEVETEILFLKKAPSIDATGEEIDAILDELKLYAYQFLKKTESDTNPPVESYRLEATDAVNITTERLVGWRLTFGWFKVREICASY